MVSRTGTLRQGLRLGGSRIMPPGISIVPGVATPMAAMSDIFKLAAATAWRIDSHIRSSPNSWPRWASVGRLTEPSDLPWSSTTPAFIEVPPTSRPTKSGLSMSLPVRASEVGLAGIRPLFYDVAKVGPSTRAVPFSPGGNTFSNVSPALGDTKSKPGTVTDTLKNVSPRLRQRRAMDGCAPSTSPRPLSVVDARGRRALLLEPRRRLSVGPGRGAQLHRGLGNDGRGQPDRADVQRCAARGQAGAPLLVADRGLSALGDRRNKRPAPLGAGRSGDT